MFVPLKNGLVCVEKSGIFLQGAYTTKRALGENEEESFELFKTFFFHVAVMPILPAFAQDTGGKRFPVLNRSQGANSVWLASYTVQRREM